MRDVLWLAVLVVGAGCLTQSKFEERYLEKRCEETAKCAGSSSDECLVLDIECSDGDYDRGAARDCLSSEWSCNTDFPGFEYPIKPTSCDNVCGGGEVASEEADAA